MDRRSLLDRAAKSAEERVLLGHILDKYDQCRQRNLPTNTAFLSPAEAQSAANLSRKSGFATFSTASENDPEGSFSVYRKASQSFASADAKDV